MPLVIDAVAIFLFDGGIDDGDQSDTALLHLGGKRFEIGEALGMDGEILEIIHIVDVEVQHIQWDACLFVFIRTPPDVILCHIAPAALSVAERPLGRQIALADQGAELADDRFQALARDDVQVKREALGRDTEHIAVGIADVKGDLAGQVKERADPLLAVDQDEVVRTVDRALVLGMERLVGAPTLIDPSALVDAAHGLAETVDACFLVHFQREAVLGHGEGLGCSVRAGEVFDDGACGNEGVIAESFDHSNSSHLIF